MTIAIANANPLGLLETILAILGVKRERDDQGRRRRGTWMQSHAGRKVWPLDPRADEFTFDDWVIGTARECRFGRQSLNFYSVAEHELLVSLYVERIARERGWPEDIVLLAARQAHTHDKSEAVTGDMPRPMKHQPEMRQFRKMEARIQACAFEYFGVRPTRETTALVKEVDNRILVDEIEALMPCPSMYLERHARVEGLGATIAAMPWERAAAAWTQRFCELWPDWEEEARADAWCAAVRDLPVEVRR